MTSRAITLTGYTVIVGLVAVWTVATSVKPQLPTLAAVVRVIAAPRLGRVLLLLGWAWLGWHLFVRGSAGFDS